MECALVTLRDGNFVLEGKTRASQQPEDEPSSSVTPDFKSKQAAKAPRSVLRFSVTRTAPQRNQHTRETVGS